MKTHKWRNRYTALEAKYAGTIPIDMQTFHDYAVAIERLHSHALGTAQILRSFGFYDIEERVLELVSELDGMREHTIDLLHGGNKQP